MDILAKALSDVLARVASDYALDHAELLSRYLSTPSPAPPPPVVLKVPQVALCTAKTAKGLPCKYKPQKGSCVCKIHASKVQEEPPRPEPEPKEPPKKKKAPKKVKAAVPEHTHALTEDLSPDNVCQLCDTHGSVLDPKLPEAEFELADDDDDDLTTRLKAILCGGNEEEDLEEDLGEEVLAEDEDFEDDDDSQARFLGAGEGQEERQGGRREGRRGRDRGERGGDRQRRDGGRQERGNRRDRGEQGERGEREERSSEPRQRQQRKPIVVDKEARLYVGAGATHGISGEALTQDVINLCGLNAGDVHRVSVRENYSFVDVPEAVADQVVEKLGDSSVPSTGSKYYVKRAVTLSIPREGASEEAQSDSGFEGGESHESHGSSEGHHAEEGPTLLAVDDQA